LRGRGTRVFEAIELDENGEPNGPRVVLKDIWIDSDRMREGDILSSLYESADGEDRRSVEKHFLTTICHGDVRTGNDMLDDTGKVLMRGLEIRPDCSLFELQRNPIMQNSKRPSGSEGLRATIRVQVSNSHQRYEHKTHYRVVFKEIGTTIDNMTSLPDVMKVLKDTAGGAF
jgi:hypothetical protein